jgi:hypothetical protein
VTYKLGIVGSRVWTNKVGQVWNIKIKNPKNMCLRKWINMFLNMVNHL